MVIIIIKLWYFYLDPNFTYNRNKRGDFIQRRKLILIIATLLYGIFGIGIYGVMNKSITYTLLSLALLLVVRVLSIFLFIRYLTHTFIELKWSGITFNFLDWSNCRKRGWHIWNFKNNSVKYQCEKQLYCDGSCDPNCSEASSLDWLPPKLYWNWLTVAPLFVCLFWA